MYAINVNISIYLNETIKKTCLKTCQIEKYDIETSEIESKYNTERNLHEKFECKNHLKRYFKGKLSMSLNGKCENIKLIGLREAQYVSYHVYKIASKIVKCMR